MKANTGIYKVEKGQKLVGSCHLAQRDRRVFGVPGCKDVNEFDPTRFKTKVSGQLLHCLSLKNSNHFSVTVRSMLFKRPNPLVLFCRALNPSLSVLMVHCQTHPLLTTTSALEQ